MQTCSYDSKSNLFAFGWKTEKRTPGLVELPNGSSKFINITLDAVTDADAWIQWTGKRLAIGGYAPPS